MVKSVASTREIINVKLPRGRPATDYLRTEVSDLGEATRTEVSDLGEAAKTGNGRASHKAVSQHKRRFSGLSGFSSPSGLPSLTSLSGYSDFVI
ncbi:MAG: hypothetical protein HY751_00425 [Nitrospinae bacterium]|nr:hypothetical protein [Nitrospinota bacterium]